MTSAASEEWPGRPKAEGFARAPLIEALLDVQFADKLTADETSEARNALSSEYPAFTEHSHVEVKIDAEAESVELEAREIHYRGEARDPTEVVLVRPSGLATSQLAPYRDWHALFRRFSRDLGIVTKTVGPRKLSRMAVRSINRIDVPPNGDLVRYEDYIAAHPNLPAELDPIADFNLRLMVDAPEIQARARITIARTEPAVEGKASFILDIDLFGTDDLPADEAELERSFARYREVKNRLYRSCLTKRALKEFEE